MTSFLRLVLASPYRASYRLPGSRYISIPPLVRQSEPFFASRFFV